MYFSCAYGVPVALWCSYIQSVLKLTSAIGIYIYIFFFKAEKPLGHQRLKKMKITKKRPLALEYVASRLENN